MASGPKPGPVLSTTTTSAAHLHTRIRFSLQTHLLMKITRIPNTIALSLLLVIPIGAQTARNESVATASQAPAATVSTVTTTSDPFSPPDDEIVRLSLFEVSASSHRGYFAPTSLAGSRLNTQLEDLGAAITVVTPEFLRDIGANNNQTLLSYTTNTEVGGVYGNFKGASGAQDQDESGRFINPNSNTRVRGLSSADNTRNFFVSEIPWDGYNIDRVDMQRGASSILFGLGSPAGIINTTLKTAAHRNFGEASVRVGSYGSTRGTLDINQNILPNELSIRAGILGNKDKYRQDPAFSSDQRIFGTLRYDPRFLSRNGATTSIRLNYEGGKIHSNNPRTITPTDRITPWWDNMNKTLYDPNTVQNSRQWYDQSGAPYWRSDVGQFNQNRTDAAGISTPNPYFEPWLGAPGSMYGGVWLQVAPGQSTPDIATMPEFKNVFSINSSGVPKNTNNNNGILGLPFSRRVAPATTEYWAERAKPAFYNWGLWKSNTLSDPSIFDFYNNLIDGDNKEESQKFNNFSATLTQTFLDHRLGFEGAFNHENVDRGQYSYNGTGILYIDINSYNLDGTPNQNAGRPYVQSNYYYGNNSYESDRDSWRLSAYFDQQFHDAHHRDWFWKLLGRQTISGLVSGESWKTDSRNFARYWTPDSFANLVGTGTNNPTLSLASNERAVTSTIYLGDSLMNASTYRGAGIPGPGTVQIPSTVDWHFFDSHWNAPTVDPGAQWTSTYNGNPNLTQSENPANYVGWTTTPVQILSAQNGDQDALTWQATKNKRDVESIAGTWQAYFWDGAVVGLFGIRRDKVKTWSLGGPLAAGTNRVDFTNYNFSNPATTYSEYSKNTTSEGLVVKLNKLVPDHWLPINVNLYYNKSDNFQVTGPRNDVFGHPLPLPTGDTKEMGILLATKDQRFVLKINKYETKVKNANNTTGFATWFLFGTDNFIMRNAARADTYQYHLATPGVASSANTTTGLIGSGGWVWRYYPRPGETQADADALAASAVESWRAYVQEPAVQKILSAWGFDDFSKIQTPSMSRPVANFQPTEDQLSKGWEFEFTANPAHNWRITFNAAQTKASRSNIGGSDLQNFIELTNTYINDPKGFGQLRTWGGDNTSSTSLLSWNSNFYASYLLMKMQEGTFSNELRKWRFNLITNYDFDTGCLKGLNIGAGYRWQDKVAIGYPVKEVSGGSTSQIVFDLDNPYYGPTNTGVDFWIGYTMNLTRKIRWNIQFNIRDLGAGKKLIPLTTQYDGTVAAWGIAPSQTWTLTNTFSF